MKWADFIFPPINLWCYPKQYEDYTMLNEETTVKPMWKVKEPLIPITKEFLEEAISMGLGTSKPIKHDPINSPSDIQVEGDHYKKMSIEPWDVMEVVLTEEEFRGYLKGNFIKYAMRDGKKPGAIRDADKAWHYKTKLDEVVKTRV